MFVAHLPDLLANNVSRLDRDALAIMLEPQPLAAV